MAKYSLPSHPIFPIYFFFVFGLIIVVGLTFLVDSPLIGIPVILFGLALIFLRQGFQFNKEDNTFREFSSTFGLKWGKWKSIAPFSCIVVTRKRMASGIYVGTTVSAGKTHNYYSSINLSDDSHLSKTIIYTSSNSKRCQLNAQRISEYLNLPIKAYNPKKLDKKRPLRSKNSK